MVKNIDKNIVKNIVKKLLSKKILTKKFFWATPKSLDFWILLGIANRKICEDTGILL